MRFTIATILAFAAAAAVAAPAPEEHTSQVHQITQRDATNSGETINAHHGDLTYYSVGLGSCGWTNTDSELVAAVSVALHDRLKPCGRKMRITRNGKSVDVKVVDKCMGCAEWDVDLSPTAFEKVVGSLGVGRAAADWVWI